MPPRHSARSATVKNSAESQTHVDDYLEKKRPHGDVSDSDSDSKAAPPSKKPASPKKAVKKGAAKKEEGEEGGEDGKEKKPDTGFRGSKRPEKEGNADPGSLPTESYFQSMGTGETERRHGLLESGEIYFLYRPRVEIEEAHSMDDVARLHLLLVPKLASPPTDGSRPHRLLLVGRKHIPYARSSGRPDIMWGEIIEVGDDFRKLKERLGPYSYDTKTLGERHIAAAKVVGQGHYVLNSSEANKAPKNSKNQSAIYKTYLAYSLTTPSEIGQVQKDFNIQHAAALQLSVKEPNARSNNPAVRDPPDHRKPKYPDALQKLFVTKFIPANPSATLDYPGAELLLIPSKHELKEDLGEKVVKDELEVKDDEDEGEEEHDPKAAEHAEKVLKDLGWEENKADVGVLEGHWS